jgi:opacity protein-like surface antigen
MRSDTSHFSNRRSIAIAIAIVLCASAAAAERSERAPAVGYDYGEISTGRSLAMGGALRAFSNGTTALYVNPANMAMTRVFHLQGLAAIWPESRRQSYGASAVELRNNRLAGGVGAHYSWMDPDGVNRKWTDVRLGLAVPFSEKFYAGLCGRYLKLSQEGGFRLNNAFGGPTDPVAAGLRDQAIVNNFSFDAGITVRPTPSLAIGIVGANLTNPGHGFLPTTLGGGVGFGTRDFTVEADLVGDFSSYLRTDGSTKTTVRAMFGGEYLLADHYPVRLGYRYDQGARSHAVSGGLGYVDTQFSLELGLRRTVSGPSSAVPSTAIVIEVQYFIESSGVFQGPTDID